MSQTPHSTPSIAREPCFGAVTPQFVCEHENAYHSQRVDRVESCLETTRV
jgi:hypothetical protein